MVEIQYGRPMDNYNITTALIAFAHNLPYATYESAKRWWLLAVAIFIGGALLIGVYLNNRNKDGIVQEDDRTASSLKYFQGFLGVMFVIMVLGALIIMSFMETNTYRKVLGSILPLTPVVGTVAFVYFIIELLKNGLTLRLLAALLLLPAFNSIVFRLSRYMTYRELIKYFDSCEMNNLEKCASYKGYLNNNPAGSFLTYLMNIPGLSKEAPGTFKIMAENLKNNDILQTFLPFLL